MLPLAAMAQLWQPINLAPPSGRAANGFSGGGIGGESSRQKGDKMFRETARMHSLFKFSLLYGYEM